MQGRFEGEKFTYSLFLVFCNRILACIVAIIALLVRHARLCAWHAHNTLPHALPHPLHRHKASL